MRSSSTRSRVKIFAFLGVFLSLTGCATKKDNLNVEESAKAPPEKKVEPNYLKVGVVPDNPPMIFKMRKDIVGVEADFAKKLAEKLGRPLRFVELEAGEKIPSLLEKRTDIIMSNMSITEARKIRIAFSKPYLKISLFALMRSADAHKYPTRESIVMADGDVGVKRGTTADAFVQKNMPYARRWALSAPSDGPFELERKRIDLFIHDGPIIAWLMSEHEADLTALAIPLSDDLLGWGIRRGDEAFLSSVNQILDEWKADGTVDRVIERWIPHMKRGK